MSATMSSWTKKPHPNPHKPHLNPLLLGEDLKDFQSLGEGKHEVLGEVSTQDSSVGFILQDNDLLTLVSIYIMYVIPNKKNK